MRSGSIRFEPGFLHSPLRFGILHKDFPDIAAARIFGHDHGDAGINTDHVGVVPVFQRVERIYKSVAAPRLWIMGTNISQHTYGFAGYEWQGPSGCMRSNRAIDGTYGRWSAPNQIA